MQKLEHWYFTEGYHIFDFILPRDKARVGGIIYGHERIPDGTNIKIMEIQHFDKEKLIVNDSNDYQLGEIHNLYAEYLKVEEYEDIEKLIKAA